MRIIRVIPELDFGGVEQVLANSLPAFKTLPNIEIWVIVLSKGGKCAKLLQIKGINVTVLNKNLRIPNISLVFKLLDLIKLINPDVVHCQAAEANFHGLIAARLAGVPVRIGEEIGFPNHHSYWKYIFRLVYKNATKVIAISQAVKDRIVELGEVEEEKVEVVYNPVEIGDREKRLSNSSLDFSLRASVRIDKGKPFSFGEAVSDGIESEERKPFVFVTTCRLVPVKNLDRLITAFARLRNEFSEKTIELWIVGDGPLRESLENQSKELGITENVKFWGFQENVYPFLENSDVFVLPSLSEGSSVSLVEAMSVGLPSIVTKVGGTLEIIGNSKSAFLIDPLDEYSIFKALYDYIDLSKDQRTVLGQRAQIESTRFSVENYSNRLLNIYSNPGS
ncbi:glycosyltransferase [Cecembia rubra]|uniref:Glycosyltransferase involved in cell wall biosynthesis n=1 Tax=Cecembia rubra TaxID=1485585 RepID=A0A2P8DVL8_9BACT|nr:glycosyltransferase [Cecembia rubra]PSL01256.1 glycosyltransferase involved in cell wall biosynthesis [Cecembia rubra]